MEPTVRSDGTSIVKYKYDYSGIRVLKERADGTRIFYLSGLFNYGSIYELLQKPNRADHHTKYLYGIQSDRLIQITRKNATIAMQLNNENLLSSFYSYASFFGLFRNMKHGISAWLMTH